MKYIQNQEKRKKGKCNPKQHKWVLLKQGNKITISWICSVCGKLLQY